MANITTRQATARAEIASNVNAERDNCADQSQASTTSQSADTSPHGVPPGPGDGYNASTSVEYASDNASRFPSRKVSFSDNASNHSPEDSTSDDCSSEEDESNKRKPNKRKLSVAQMKKQVTAAKKRTKNVVEELAGTKKELQAAKKDAREKANAVIELGKEMKSMKGSYNKLQSENNALNKKCNTNLRKSLETEATLGQRIGALKVRLTQAENGMKLAETKTGLIKSTLDNCKIELGFAVKERQKTESTHSRMIQKVQTTDVFNNQKNSQSNKRRNNAGAALANAQAMQNVGMMGLAGMMGQGLPLFRQNSSNLQRFQSQGLNSVNNGHRNQSVGYYQQDGYSGYHTGTAADASHQSVSKYGSHYEPPRRTHERLLPSNDASHQSVSEYGSHHEPPRRTNERLLPSNDASHQSVSKYGSHYEPPSRTHGRLLSSNIHLNNHHHLSISNTSNLGSPITANSLNSDDAIYL